MPFNWPHVIRVSRERNLGANLGSWRERMECAWGLFLENVRDLPSEVEVGDYGCGRQELREFLPPEWSYVPYDRMLRSEDTRVVDLDRELPGEFQDVIFCLGVLEYMSEPERLLRHMLGHARWVVFSHFGGWNPWRSWKQGWKGRLSAGRLSAILKDEGARIVAHTPWRRDGGIWVCEAGGRRA